MIAGFVLLGLTLAVSPRGGEAQGTTGSPVASPEMAHQHPAHIHTGTCDTLGSVVYPLTDLTPPEAGGTPMAGTMASPVAGMAATPTGLTGEIVAQSTTTVEATLEILLAAPHAINVHESPERIENYLACGEITGAATAGALEIPLHELNASGDEGMARLVDNGDGTTTVTVWLTRVAAGAATPEATPSS
jgi:hypothetical protein